MAGTDLHEVGSVDRWEPHLGHTLSIKQHNNWLVVDEMLRAAHALHIRSLACLGYTHGILRQFVHISSADEWPRAVPHALLQGLWLA